MDPVTNAPTAVRVLAHYAHEWAAVVDYADGSGIVTRWHRDRPRPYRCADCGRATQPDCKHLRAAVHALEALEALTEETAP